MSMKNSNDTIGNRTRDLPACSAVPQPTAQPRAPRGYGPVVRQHKGMMNWERCLKTRQKWMHNFGEEPHGRNPFWGSKIWNDNTKMISGRMIKIRNFFVALRPAGYGLLIREVSRSQNKNPESKLKKYQEIIVKQSNIPNPLNAELNPICYLLALLAHHFLHVSRIRVKSLTLRLLMSYIYIYIYRAPILDVSRSHTTTQHSR